MFFTLNRSFYSTTCSTPGVRADCRGGCLWQLLHDFFSPVSGAQGNEPITNPFLLVRRTKSPTPNTKHNGYLTYLVTFIYVTFFCIFALHFFFPSLLVVVTQIRDHIASGVTSHSCMHAATCHVLPTAAATTPAPHHTTPTRPPPAVNYFMIHCKLPKRRNDENYDTQYQVLRYYIL